MKKTQLQALPSNKMKTCVMGSHTLLLSNGTPDSIFKSLYLREIKDSFIPKSQNFQITVDRFVEDCMIEIKQGCEWTDDSKLDK